MELVRQNKHGVDVCYHHTDHDGYCAAAIVGAPRNIRLGYSTKVTATDLLNTCSGKVVAMVDFSLEPLKMRQIKDVAKKFIWIDHHETAEVCRELDLDGLFSIEKAGCELTWDFFHPNEEMPDVVRYVGDRDIWKFSYPETRIYGFGLNVTKDIDDPSSETWTRLISSNQYTPNILTAGEIAARVVDSDTGWTERMNLFRDGKVFVINVTSNVSELASNILDQNGRDCLVMAWQLSKKGLRISFRGEGAKESAEYLGASFGVRGGGHKLAAGIYIPLDHPLVWSVLKGLYKNARKV